MISEPIIIFITLKLPNIIRNVQFIKILLVLHCRKFKINKKLNLVLMT